MVPGTLQRIMIPLMPVIESNQHANYPTLSRQIQLFQINHLMISSIALSHTDPGWQQLSVNN
jgi:hypothetical protein